VDKETVSRIIDARIKQGGGYLDQLDSYEVLKGYGFPVCKVREVRELEDLREAGQQVGYPVVLKVAGRDLIHKSDIGGVMLDIKDEKELVWAFLEMKRNLAKHGLEGKVDKFLIQEMSRPGQEIILGMTLDPKFGPLLVAGTGGKYVEILKDVEFGVTPLTDLDAKEMIESIRGYPLLKGVRGEEPVCIDIAIECLQRLAQLVTDFQTIREIDINPIILVPKKENCRVVDVRISVEAESAAEVVTGGAGALTPYRRTHATRERDREASQLFQLVFPVGASALLDSSTVFHSQCSSYQHYRDKCDYEKQRKHTKR
jgi:acyl-CoA synthetase (NDP forming)